MKTKFNKYLLSLISFFILNSSNTIADNTPLSMTVKGIAPLGTCALAYKDLRLGEIINYWDFGTITTAALEEGILSSPSGSNQILSFNLCESIPQTVSIVASGSCNANGQFVNTVSTGGVNNVVMQIFMSGIVADPSDTKASTTMDCNKTYNWEDIPMMSSLGPTGNQLFVNFKLMLEAGTIVNDVNSGQFVTPVTFTISYQ